MQCVTVRPRAGLLACVTLLLIAALACTLPGQPERDASVRGRQNAPSATPSPATAGPEPPTGFSLAPVRVGPITEVVSFRGRVTGSSEAPVGPPLAARIGEILVDVGSVVQEGQPLADEDTREVQDELESARARLATSEATLGRARTRVEARLRRAEEEVARLTAPPPVSERLQAQGVVAAAQESLRKAQSDLERVSTPPTPSTVRTAEQAVVAAQVAVSKAEEDLARVHQGPDPSDVRKAENDVDLAKSAHARAVEAQRTLLEGGERYNVRSAERAVAEAQSNLQLLREQRPLPIVVVRTTDERADREARRRAEREAENIALQRAADIRKAELALQNTLDQLAKARQAPPRAEVESAERLVTTTRRSVEDAQERLAILRGSPTRHEVASAEAALGTARANLERALASLDEAQAGPSEADVAAARGSVAQARNAVAVAVAKQDELLASRTTETEDMRAAQERADLLRWVLAAPPEAIDEAMSALESKERELTEAFVAYRDALKAHRDDEQRAAEADVRAAAGPVRVVAPFGGVVTEILTRPGEMAGPDRPVLHIGRADDPIIKAEVGRAEGARIAAGQGATVAVDEGATPLLGATVADVAEREGGRVVFLRVAWGAAPPNLGATVQGTVAVQEKAAVLLVPRRAVTSVGARRYVDVYERPVPRRVQIEIGIAAGDDVEVNGALREGQQVLVAP